MRLETGRLENGNHWIYNLLNLLIMHCFVNNQENIDISFLKELQQSCVDIQPLMALT